MQKYKPFLAITLGFYNEKVGQSNILTINDFIEEVVEEYDTERDEDAGEKKMVKVSKIQKFCSFRLLQTFSTYCDILAGTFKYDLN